MLIAVRLKMNLTDECEFTDCGSSAVVHGVFKDSHVCCQLSMADAELHIPRMPEP